MKGKSVRLLIALFVFAVSATVGFGQVTPNGSITGTVTDPHGAVVPNATVTVKNSETGRQRTATTSDSGIFSIPQIPTGMYVVTVEAASGFKKSEVKNVKVDVGMPATVNVTLELGNPQETVTVVGGGELIQTQSATIGTTLTGRQITDLPTASRDAMDLILALPGTSTVGRPRQSSVNGLPKGALNITLDGVNVQDNLLKSNDGFFTYIRPRTDAISEVTISTSTPGSESSGEGSVQIKFVTQGGTNEYHGGGYWYYRSPSLNSAYWFNNRDLPPDPITHKAPRTSIILNQPGFKVGGPIRIPKVFNGKDKAFFFVNYEEYRLPESTLRTRNILSSQAQSGIYRFFASSVSSALNTTCVAAPPGSSGAFLCSTDLYARAAGAGLAFANADPTVSALLGQIRSSLGNTTIKDTGDPNIQQATFINTGGQLRRFPTVRFDFNVGKHHVENIWNYQEFGGVVDFLNSRDPQFPGFPNHGSQTSLRFSNSTAWRWTISNNLVNEARYGITGGTVLFFGEVNSGQFSNQGGYNLGLGNFTSGGLTLTSATNTTAPSRRNSPVKEFSDNLNWVKGNHSFNFGVTDTRIGYWNFGITVVPSVVFTTSSTLDPDPVNAFSTLAATQQAGASQLYALLSGRMTALNANAQLSETTNQYSYLGPLISRAKSEEWGVFGQDTWRFRQNVTLTFGLRYERQKPIEASNNTFAGVSYADLFGESGVNNLFKPGTLTGSHSSYTLFGTGSQAYNAPATWLPSFGFTYSPNFAKGMMHRLVGDSGQTVIRGGFSMASVREGTGVFTAVTGANPGGTLTTNRNLTLANLPVGTYLRQGPFAQPAFPSQPVYPNNGLLTDSVNAFDPNLKIGYVESWTLGLQREIGKDNVLEVRYVGNRGHKLWRQVDLNEPNVIENGVFSEWQLAQANLLANIAAGRGLQFRYQGPGTGTFPLPITYGYFTGLSPANAGNCTSIATCNTLYANTNFANSTYYNTMNPLNPAPILFGFNLGSTSFDSRRTPLGQACFGITGCTGLGLFPYNHFFVNPGKRSDPFLVNNSGQSWYDAVTIEFRRRLTKGLLVQSSYTFSKAMSNTYASSSAVFDQPATLRNNWLKKGYSVFDIRQGFKTNFIYDLPIGKGKTFLSNSSGLVDKVVGGWGINGNIRIQSGSPFNFAAPLGLIGSSATQQNNGNVQVVGMTLAELQHAVGVYRDPDGFIYFLPADIRQNTIRAFNIAMTATGPSYTLGAPVGRFIAPAGYGNCQQSYTGQCGFANLVLHGPAFTRVDMSIVKRVKFTETVNLEMRVEYLNLLNNINFLVGAAGNDVNTQGNFTASTFARMTTAYQDLSTTNDPGGRVGQLVLRINF
jgi:hypothetical protein